MYHSNPEVKPSQPEGILEAAPCPSPSCFIVKTKHKYCAQTPRFARDPHPPGPFPHHERNQGLPNHVFCLSCCARLTLPRAQLRSTTTRILPSNSTARNCAHFFSYFFFLLFLLLSSFVFWIYIFVLFLGDYIFLCFFWFLWISFVCFLGVLWIYICLFFWGGSLDLHLFVFFGGVLWIYICLFFFGSLDLHVFLFFWLDVHCFCSLDLHVFFLFDCICMLFVLWIYMFFFCFIGFTFCSSFFNEKQLKFEWKTARIWIKNTSDLNEKQLGFEWKTPQIWMKNSPGLNEKLP